MSGLRVCLVFKDTTEESWVAPSSACDREGEALGLERLLIDDQENHRLN